MGAVLYHSATGGHQGLVGGERIHGEPAQAEYSAYVFGHGGVAAKFASEAFGQHGLGKVVFSRAEAACGDYQL